MLCKPLFITIMAELRPFKNLYWSTKPKCLSLNSGWGACITRLHKHKVSSQMSFYCTIKSKQTGYK